MINSIISDPARLIAKYGSKNLIVLGNWSAIVTLSPSTKALPTAITFVAVLARHQVTTFPVTSIHDVEPANAFDDDTNDCTKDGGDVGMGSSGDDGGRDVVKNADVSRDLIPYLSVVLAEDDTVAIVSLGAGLGVLQACRKNIPKSDRDDDEVEEQIGLQLHVLAPDCVNALIGRSAMHSVSIPSMLSTANPKKRKLEA
ncbi:hypothetical protein SeMB42_g00082 [Synchytrium endobioticum]|uniref:Uncharacterized protein n=1 Tax=Synchytrium endobioticum TaxID=286115 RepID=A0A507DUH8_9FUNG|nr:hypothetical protein SeLEV6574_g00188 [Synchytrium endobioticum]TPX54856.1 hypothetical protein SeMB42_g00079 [Synchytrium endobioticum]TPX54885.1 hypothetical protein SeMB42_g00082 [Synchytrium endobioticum]